MSKYKIEITCESENYNNLLELVAKITMPVGLEVQRVSNATKSNSLLKINEDIDTLKKNAKIKIDTKFVPLMAIRKHVLIHSEKTRFDHHYTIKISGSNKNRIKKLYNLYCTAVHGMCEETDGTKTIPTVSVSLVTGCDTYILIMIPANTDYYPDFIFVDNNYMKI